jgi:hypothetical protein
MLLYVFDSKFVADWSSGRREEISLFPPRTIADVYADVPRALSSLGVACFIPPVPQEVPDTTPMHDDRRVTEYDRKAVLRWFETYTAVAGVFERWRSRFFGRSGVQVWWGALDVALILFNGKHTKPPADRGYLMKYDLDAELMNVGLYLGDEQNAPFFFGYIYPQPEGADSLALTGSKGSWSEQWHEWILPYETVRNSVDPEQCLTDFIDAIYNLCFEAAGWDRKALSYKIPARRGP